MFRIAFLLFMMFTVVAHAGGRPSWTLLSPRTNGQYRYDVGRGTGEMSDKNDSSSNIDLWVAGHKNNWCEYSEAQAASPVTAINRGDRGNNYEC